MMNEENPWKINASDQKYDNPWIRVTENQVTNPSGKPGIYGVVHFKNLAIGIVPYQNGMIWLVGQWRFPLDTYSWEIPEGGGQPDTDPMESAKRELKEETGITAKKFEKIVEMDLSNSVSDEKAIIFLATQLEAGESSPEETEQLSIRKVTLEEAYSMVEKNEIRDSLTVAAIYKMMLLKFAGKLEE